MQKSIDVEGYSIYHPDVEGDWGGYRFDFDKTIGATIETVNVTHNQNRLELRTFGARPYVYYAGHTNYQSFALHGIFVDESNLDGDVDKTALEIYNEFKKVVDMRIPLKVENSMGEVLNCDVVLDQRVAPLQYSKGGVDFVEVNISCVEIDEVGR